MFPEHWSLSQIIRHAVKEILLNHKPHRERDKLIMAALDDVKAALAAVSDKETALGVKLDAFIAANSGGASDADLQALIPALQALGAGIDAISAKLDPPAAS